MRTEADRHAPFRINLVNLDRSAQDSMGGAGDSPATFGDPPNESPLRARTPLSRHTAGRTWPTPSAFRNPVGARFTAGIYPGLVPVTGEFPPSAGTVHNSSYRSAYLEGSPWRQPWESSPRRDKPRRGRQKSDPEPGAPTPSCRCNAFTLQRCNPATMHHPIQLSKNASRQRISLSFRPGASSCPPMTNDKTLPRITTLSNSTFETNRPRPFNFTF